MKNKNDLTPRQIALLAVAVAGDLVTGYRLNGTSTSNNELQRLCRKAPQLSMVYSDVWSKGRHMAKIVVA
jgi:hypothetical protein